jgi:hypothetical protein
VALVTKAVDDLVSHRVERIGGAIGMLTGSTLGTYWNMVSKIFGHALAFFIWLTRRPLDRRFWFLRRFFSTFSLTVWRK